MAERLVSLLPTLPKQGEKRTKKTKLLSANNPQSVTAKQRLTRLQQSNSVDGCTKISQQ